ncbi:RpiB/LacA/LacB family sugar-phosphate isomerase [Rhizobium ruizarguesonis]
MVRFRLLIGGDSNGSSHAQALCDGLKDAHDVHLVGCTDGETYADLAEHVTKCVIDGDYDIGILLCGTGMGVSATAGKLPRIIAVGPIWNKLAAEAAATSNRARVITFAARFSKDKEHDRDQVVELARIFLENVPKFDPKSNSAKNVAAILRVDEKYRRMDTDVA